MKPQQCCRGFTKYYTSAMKQRPSCRGFTYYRKKVPQKVKMWNQIQMLMKSRTAFGVENDENGAMYEKHC